MFLTRYQYYHSTYYYCCYVTYFLDMSVTAFDICINATKERDNLGK